ncbi:HBL132Cp [Eremothecium sinecaudum]|uniref:HBL132Cp n=1 Tax=Eremothecium sinecaudum TaxID=45286 RepID=A0A109UWE5_9SACH|nr:HBL132Cp [Eremothecium sinecaudum]AMD18770.1 HBL132Cp [Eremothecium sinecaudum]
MSSSSDIIEEALTQSQVVSKETVTDASTCKWIGLTKIKYKDPNNVIREWEMAVRKSTASIGIDGVAIIAIVIHPDRAPRLLLVKQFRPPLEGLCIELPAGLIDEGETAEEAAMRELKEETGYRGTVKSVGKTIYADPGFTNTNLVTVTVEIDETLPENQHPKQHLEESEFIECLFAPLNGLAAELSSLEKGGCKIDARLSSIAEGFELARSYF